MTSAELASVRRETVRGDDPLPTAWATVHVVYPTEHASRLPVHGLRSIVLGRDPDPEDPRKITHDSVSRRHLEIAWDDELGSYVAHELGSRNGVWVDGRRLDPNDPRPIASGAVLRMGDVVAVFETGQGDLLDDAAVDTQQLPGRSAVAGRLREAMGRLARDGHPIVLLGEEGTPKLRVASELHRLAQVRGGVHHVDAGVLDSVTLRRRLFGQEGVAELKRPGVFEKAGEGLVFLDAIEQLPLEHQDRILDLLNTEAVMCRLVFGCSRDIQSEVDAGRIRSELRSRLYGRELDLPCLREQRSDILAWFDVLTGGERYHFDPDAVEQMLLADWAKNVEDLVRMADAPLGDASGRVRARDLAPWCG